MLFPWSDWQFWLVTVIAFGCAWVVVRQLLPRGQSSTSCGACASGTAACAKHAVKAKSEPQLVVLSSRRRG